MASATSKVANFAVWSSLIVLGLFILFAIYTLSDGLKGIAEWLKNTLGNFQGDLQSLKNANEGFQDGADPGTIPGFDLMQGTAESIRNFHDYVFGSDEDNDANSAPDQPITLAPATPDMIGNVQGGLQEYEQFAQNPEPWQDQALGAALQNGLF